MENTDESKKYLCRLLGEDGQQPVDAGADVVKVQLPPWFDAERFHRGQKFHQKFYSGAFGAMFSGLISILAVPSILKILICTGKSDTADKAYRRYVKTIFHVVTWTNFDLQPDTEAWKSIEIVRRKHLNARKYCEKAEKMTITQCDMAVTQFGFMGYIVLRSKMVGIHVDNEDEFKDAIYFWRVVGFMMGITDEFNLCTDSLAETKGRLKIVLEQVIRPALESPIASFKPMAAALTSGLWHYSHLINEDGAIFLVKRLVGCKGYEYFDRDFEKSPTKEDRAKMEYYKLSVYQRFTIWFAISVMEYALKFKLFRWYYNVEVKLAEWRNYYLPITAIWKFGIEKAYVRIFPSKRNNKVKHIE